jgi:hypothetical protein
MPASRQTTRRPTLPSRSASRQDVGAIARRAFVGSGTALPSDQRAEFEPRLGWNFAQVRIHIGPDAADAADGLGARAFQLGKNIAFARDAYAPSRAEGRRLLAHELAHVVQDGRASHGAAPPSARALSDPADHSEIVAERAAQAAMAFPSMSVAPIPPVPARSGPPVVHRFLAGEEGHGGVEEEALKEVGFSEKEYEETYYGNWLRDFSQLLQKDSLEDPQMLEIIRTLATGEFGRAPTDSDLGRYLPSEHVDRPEGGRSAEDPELSEAGRDLRFYNLSAEQRAWVLEERTAPFQMMIDERFKASGLPTYIERGKEHAKREIALAAAAGRNARGLQALGNGLHAVEDYFAHSNFVEVALAQLGSEGQVSPNDPRLQAKDHYAGVDPAHIGTDMLGRPQIVTGTAAPGANDKVGMWEALKTEVGNHQFLKTLFRSAIRRPWQAFKTIGKLVLGKLGSFGGGLVGGVLGSVGGLFAGAGRGAAAGWRSGRHWWSKPFTAIAGLLSGAATGLVSGAKTGGTIGSEIGGAVGRFFGPVFGPLIFPATMLLGTIICAGDQRRPARGRTLAHPGRDAGLHPRKSRTAADAFADRQGRSRASAAQHGGPARALRRPRDRARHCRGLGWAQAGIGGAGAGRLLHRPSPGA